VQPLRIAIIVGFATVVIGLVVGSQNIGSCPSNQPDCDHTFPNTGIWIGQTSGAIIIGGLALLVVSLVLTLYRRMTQANVKLE
jgi:hypothetical protein